MKEGKKKRVPKKKKRSTSNDKSMMQVWEAYVKAQEIIINQYSQSFKAKYKNSQNNGTHVFEHIDDDKEETLIYKLKEAFPEILSKDIFIKRGYFLYKADLLKSLDKNNLERFKKYCDANYYDFVPNPCISGIIKLTANPFEVLAKKFRIRIDRNGRCEVTAKQINQIDNFLKGSSELRRNSKIGVILQNIQASEYLMNKEYRRVEKYLKDRVNFEDFTSWGYNNTITLKNIRISERHRLWIEENTLYDSFHRVIIEPKEGVGFKIKNVGLPDLINNQYHFIYDKTLSLGELKFRIEDKRRAFNMYLGNGNFTLIHEQVFKIDNEKSFLNLKKIIPNNHFQISEDTSTIAFDYENNEELEQNLNILDNIKELSYKYFGENHKFKVQLDYSTPLEEATKHIQEIPSVSTYIHKGGTECVFNSYFDKVEELVSRKNVILNKLDDLNSSLYKYNITNIADGYVRFNLYFRKEEYEEETQLKFKYLRGEEVILSGKRGVLKKVKYPKLFIDSDEYSFLNKDDEYLIEGNLKGEKDKIKRLSDAVNAVFGNGRIENNNLKEILVDASKAKISKENILESVRFKEKLRFIESEMLASEGRLNEKQKEAVTKSLLGRDLFIIQGPPGTGKSTAIAEIIWQHIRDKSNYIKNNRTRNRNKYHEENTKYKILVTSETNLAVDNALDKLRSKHHTLIKPIRFGSEEKLDKEGRRFSLENLQHWTEYGIEEIDEENNSKVNIIRDWINQIESRVEYCDNEGVDNVLSDWKKILSNPDDETRKIFFEAYSRNVNVVGATCSSIGKLSSTRSQTRFFQEYNTVYYPKRDYKKAFETEIKFDLVIQDEASKASPPELALPCIYGKKAIVIGDHRQLPPMLDTNEFIENLEYLRNRSSDRKYRNDIGSLIDTIKKNINLFEKSHFERLFYAIPNNLKSSFNEQYRMHPAINETIKQFYKNDNGLNCGLDNELVNLPNLFEPQSRFHGINIENLLSEDTHVLWLNVETPEYKKGTSRVNFGEIEAVEFLINKISQSNGYRDFISHWGNNELDEKQIGVITFYGSQASELGKFKKKYSKVPLRISPVDRFQGMERNIVIVSTVRSNIITEFPNQKPDIERYGKQGYPNQSSLGFAQFPNRLNVALSRAKRLLIIVGNAEHFSRMGIYRNVLKSIKSHPNGRFLNFIDIKK